MKTSARSADLFAHLAPAARERLAALQRDPRAAALVRGAKPVLAVRRDPVEVSVQTEGAAVAVVLKGLRLASEANARGHWSARATRARDARTILGAALRGATTPVGPWRVVIVRGGPRPLDTDNLAGACKAVRDAVAAWLGVDDGPEAPVSWECGQRRGGYLVEVTITGGAP